jgi:hypothetical protein
VWFERDQTPTVIEHLGLHLGPKRHWGFNYAIGGNASGPLLVAALIAFGALISRNAGVFGPGAGGAGSGGYGSDSGQSAGHHHHGGGFDGGGFHGGGGHGGGGHGGH